MPIQNNILEYCNHDFENENFQKLIESYQSNTSELLEQINQNKKTMEDINKTGMIMDAIEETKDLNEKNEAMQAAIDNDQIKKLQVLAQRYKDAHTQKVREYKKIGRNDPCPCGSGKKFKNCCINIKNWNSLILKK